MKKYMVRLSFLVDGEQYLFETIEEAESGSMACGQSTDRFLETIPETYENLHGAITVERIADVLPGGDDTNSNRLN